ncbi:hypothetical protein N7E02_18330 [Aliirhizobium terrae]|uniref:hypothetical protein n=1 Tax=Terrirhizobium terrae TaxID=2926709 RepID=UPI00257599F5|nr:hypothetical protein [Rhizobium sp. CC-CFT758]WJH42127.1 hypothetical protein N7E02_18330 [Rhizobium sp. CC-CFT758]
MTVFGGYERSIDRLMVIALGAIMASGPMAVPANAQGDLKLTNEQRWKILDCYTDMTWDSSACRKAGVTKRGEFFYGPLGTNDHQDPAFNPELDELLVDCRGVNDGYCAKEEADPAEPAAQAKQPDAPAENEWRFHSNYVKGGTLCTFGIRSGEVVVGFTAVNTSEYRGFAVGLIKKSKRAAWRVDDNLPYAVDGDIGGGGAWLTQPLRPEFLSDVAAGRELAVTSADGERIVLSLSNAADAIESFDVCRNGGEPNVSGIKPSTGAPTTTDAAQQAGSSHYTCAFRIRDVDGANVPRGMMSDRAYLRSFEVTRVSITFNADSKQFFIGDRPVQGAEVAPPSRGFAEGSAAMTYTDFATAIGLASSAAMARGLTGKQQKEWETVMKQFGGGAAKLMAPNRKVIFNADGNGALNFFDLIATGEPANFNSVACSRQ